MSFSRVFSAQINLLKGQIVSVEIDTFKGLNAFSIVGLPDKACEEAKDRVNAAVKNAGFVSPKNTNKKTVVSLAPAEIKKEGSSFDLAIALGYLLSSEDIRFKPEGKIFLGELALNGELNSIRGILPLTQAAKNEGYKEIYVPYQNAKEASLIEGITVYGVKTLDQLITHLNTLKTQSKIKFKGEKPVGKIIPEEQTFIDYSKTRLCLVDFSDIKGQESAKRGLEIAAAGGHNVCMFGPPGTGKTMLARAFSHILPQLDLNDVLEITGIHSVAGVLNESLITEAPFRSPHHTSSYVSIIGGGTIPKPGEVTLAHKGVLFLDEFPEFDKRVIESLRQPLEDRMINISRAQGSAQFPTNFILIAAMNPCPCGYLGSKNRECICRAHDLARYRRKVSGPIIDRIDIWLQVENIDYAKLSDIKNLSEETEKIKERVDKARKIQGDRFTLKNKNIKTNNEMSAKDLSLIPIEDSVRELLNNSAKKLELSPRAYHRVIKVAQTIADLENSPEIKQSHILEAIQYRPRR